MANYSQLMNGMRSAFRSGKTKSLEWRRSQLEAMLKMLDENRNKLLDALKADLNKSSFESSVMEVDLCRNDLINCMNNLSEWTKPEKVKKGLLHLMDKVYIRREPFGVTLVMSAWNYPVQLCVLPMIGAIAAGNCVVLKPSEVAAATANLFDELIPKYFDKEAIACVCGGIPETTELLKQRWDYIFYTGNSMVGKIVMKAAAEHLTPVTLELGGKSPVYVDTNVDLGIVANRIMWGKCTNAGQTCIAPDYIMCTKETQDALIEKMKVTLGDFYPNGPAQSPDYPRIVTDRHLQRVKKAVNGGGQIALGGDVNEEDRYVGPTVLSDVKFSDPVMQEEIFGPVLPIVPVSGVDEAVNHILDGSSPLSLYIFSHNQTVIQSIISRTQSGHCCVNDVLMVANIPTLPFGGIGNSGIGAYHGKFSFETFSHKRGVLERDLKMESVNNLRYPPFTQKKRNTVAWIMNKKPKRRGPMVLIPYFVFGTLVAVIVKVLLSRL